MTIMDKLEPAVTCQKEALKSLLDSEQQQAKTATRAHVVMDMAHKYSLSPQRESRDAPPNTRMAAGLH